MLVCAFCQAFVGMLCRNSVLDRVTLTTWQSVGIVTLLHIIVHLVCVSINPADSNVLIKYGKGKMKVPEFDRSQHRHVIENMHCYLCEVDV